MFNWLESGQMHRRKTVKHDREHLESKARRFFTNYLAADEVRKHKFYRAVEHASKECQPAELALQSSDLEDAQIAEATSNAAMKIVLAREKQSVPDQDVRLATFVTDAYATVAVAYHRAAGVYVSDKEMQELGTAAVHLLTMATSYMMAQKD